MLAKLFADDVLCSFEGDVPNEQRVTRLANLISIGFGTIGSFVLKTSCTCVIVARRSEVDVDLSVVNHLALHVIMSLGSISSVDIFDVAETKGDVSVRSRCMNISTNPFERPVALSEITRTPDNSPKLSNSLVNQSSSTFHERLPTKRFLTPLPAPLDCSSFFTFFAAGVASVSALRFLGGASSSLPSEESESESAESASTTELSSLPESSLSSESSPEACSAQSAASHHSVHCSIVPLR